MSGFAYNFEVYTGQEDSDPCENEEDLGKTGNTVRRLASVIPSHKNHKLYCDNFYTSLPLMNYLMSQGIHFVGTVRADRIPNCPLPPKIEQKKMERGSSVEAVAIMENGPVVAVSWKDNKSVNLLSTFAGTQPMGKVKRYDRSKKTHVQVDCPKIVTEYNKHMGGVDLLDSLLGRYKIIQRSKKWYIRLFYHLLDLSVINSWLLYVRIKREKFQPHLQLSKFRLELAQSLCKYGQVVTPTRGRPANSVKPKKSNAAKGPNQDVRLDSISHWPEYNQKRQRCKMPGCKGFSFIQCIKCKVYLCLNKNNNCFMAYHNA